MKIQHSIRSILVRDLRALQRELEAYGDEQAIWEVPPGTRNSTGNLVLHVTGNLQTFIGATLGDTGYVRDRQAEFSLREIPEPS